MVDTGKSEKIARCAMWHCQLVCYIRVMKLCEMQEPGELFPRTVWLCATCAKGTTVKILVE